MSFARLLARVRQAEHALEAQERRVAAEARQFRASWKAAWTPGRIVIAGLASGFLVGRAEPLQLAARSGQWMQLVTLLSGLATRDGAQATDTASDAGEAGAATAPGGDGVDSENDTG